jgi:hypothetical protein
MVRLLLRQRAGQAAAPRRAVKTAEAKTGGLTLQSLLPMSLGFTRLTRESEAMPESLPESLPVETVDVL